MTNDISNAAKKLGSRGGRKTKELRGKNYFRELGRKGGLKGKGGRPKKVKIS